MPVFEVVSDRLRRLKIDKGSRFTQTQSIFSFTDYSKLRMFQMNAIPGPLQTKEYIRGVFLTDIPIGSDRSEIESDLDSAMLERVKQIEKISESSRQVCFLIQENAFRTKICSSDSMAKQIEHIKVVNQHENIEIGILPWQLSYSLVDIEFPQCSFDLFDDRLLSIQVFAGCINVWDEDFIEIYSQYFSKIKSVALFGQDLVEELNRIASDL